MKPVIRNADKYLATFFLAVLILIVMAQIVMRVVFLAPLKGAEELVRYFLICVVFLGAPYAARNGGHIRMEEIQMWFPHWIRYPIRLLAFIGAMVAFGIVAYASVLTMMENLANRTATLSIPFPIFILPTVLGFTLLTVEYALKLFRFLKKSDIPRDKKQPDNQ
jgi:TRAP-type C4-dicarboxylate transport system permease small subunit